MNYVFVKIAEKLLKEINILNQKLVQQNVPIYYQEIIGLRTIKEFETIVYDLTIEDCHEYFANGILVHNCDPTSLVKLGLHGNNLYCECLLYEPIDNAPALSEVLFSMESKGLQQGIRITADCSDKYNDTEMVKELKNLGHNIYKVNKGKGISWRIGMLKKHKIHLVRNVNVKREQENYKWREINGICINEPIDKFNHFWDATGYGYIGSFLNSGIIMHG
jgi:hypothetical protein